MKTKITLMVILLISLTSLSQPAIEWQKSLGGSEDDYSYSIQQTSDGGYIIAGQSTSTDGDVTGNHGESDYWVVKLSETGMIEWQKSLGGSSFDEAISIQQTSDGGYIIVGQTASNDGDVIENHGVRDYWVVKLSTTGTIEWQKSLGGSNNEYASSIQQTLDGGYIVAGLSYSTDGDVTGNHGSADYWVVKLSATGTIEWQKSLGGSSFDAARAIQQTLDGGYIVAGTSESISGDVTGNHGLEDYWVVKLSATGTIEWQKSLGGSNNERAYSIQQSLDEGYIVAGESFSTDGDVTGNHGFQDFWIVKLSATGTIDWQKSLGGSGSDISSSVQQTLEGGYIVAGLTASNDGDVSGNNGENDYWVVKLSATGTIDWQKTMGGSAFERAFSIQQTTDEGYIIAGESSSTDGDVSGNHGSYDSWIVKLSPTLGVNDNDFDNTFLLYPNPAKDFINIEYLSDTKETMQINIFNITGRLVYSQPWEVTAGVNRFKYKNELTTGVYIVEMRTTNAHFSGKVIID